MQTEEKKKIQAFVPLSIYNQIQLIGFKSQNEAVNFAFVKLLEHQGNNKDESKNNQRESELNQNESNLINTLHATLDEKENRLKELKDHNEILNKELDKVERDKEDLKTTYNNYFLQVQTLINQKAIEAPGAKKPWWKFWQ